MCDNYDGVSVVDTLEIVFLKGGGGGREGQSKGMSGREKITPST